MRTYRRTQIVTIVALIIAVVTLGVGFAAFSATLNISSSASVNPNSSDFKVMMYGFKDEESRNSFNSSGKVFNLAYVDSTSAYGIAYDNNISFDKLLLDNSTHSINTSDIKISGNVTSVTYHVLVRNEGQYDAYIDTSEFVYNSGIMFYNTTGTCVPDSGTSASLTADACQGVVLQVILSPTGNCVINSSENYYMIPKGEYGVLSVVVGTRETTTYADGPFTVSFPNFKLNISTSK